MSHSLGFISLLFCTPHPAPTPQLVEGLQSFNQPRASLNTCPFSGFKSSISILLFNTLCQIFMHTDISFKKIHFKKSVLSQGINQVTEIICLFYGSGNNPTLSLLVSPPLRVPASLKSPINHTTARPQQINWGKHKI